jgi:hypothetical protein
VKSSISKFILGSSVVATLALLLTVPAPARANQHGAPAHMNQVHKQQQAQIRQGMKNGQLNKQQATVDVKGEKDLQSTIKKDRANGPLTGAEATQIRNQTQQENKAIKDTEGSKTSPPTPQP